MVYPCLSGRQTDEILISAVTVGMTGRQGRLEKSGSSARNCLPGATIKEPGRSPVFPSQQPAIHPATTEATVRLTLRTLLAYLDDTLDPTEIKTIGQKVAESDAAQELI